MVALIHEHIVKGSGLIDTFPLYKIDMSKPARKCKFSVRYILLEGLKHIETITLFYHHGLVPFYEGLGFKIYSSQVLMHRKGSTS
jgi:hypothetical protein